MSPNDILFYGLWRGKRIYRVVREGRALFAGTRGECSRFLTLHSEKVAREERAMASPRRRRLVPKRYRVSLRRSVAV
ncbi:MAG: hypothetical protein MUE73_00345 [Planctomycetes bacterium]|jgi:hypothetical protein|nr:hypothetical protein [Planctomycetota bacterium]